MTVTVVNATEDVVGTVGGAAVTRLTENCVRPVEVTVAMAITSFVCPQKRREVRPEL